MWKEVINHIFRRNWIFRHTICINNSHWQSGGIIILLCKYFIAISDIMVGTFMDVLFLLLAVILPGLLEKPRRNKDWVPEKKCIEEFVWGTSLFWLHALISISLFIGFFVYSLPHSTWRTCWMVLMEINNIAMEGILCDDIMSDRSKIWKSLKYLGI